MSSSSRSQITALRARAASLRAQADDLDALLAVTYRRRAQELELEAFLLEVQQAPALAA